MAGIPVEQMRQVSPVTDTDFGQGTAVAAPVLVPEIPVAMLLRVVSVAGTNPRPRADAEFTFRELAFDRNAFGRGLEKHVDARPTWLVQAVDLMLEDKRCAARFFEKSRPSAVSNDAVEKVEASEGAHRSEHALRQCLRTFEAAEPPMAFLFGNGGNDFECPCRV